jgi:hypothetical protein
MTPAPKAARETTDAAAISLEQRAVAALTDDTITSSALAALVEEARAALAEAEQVAAAEKARAFDPVVSPDPREAHARMVDAGFKADRLRTLLPRLQKRLAEAAVREHALEWLRERDKFEAERCPPLAAARVAYDDALEKMLTFLRVVSEFGAARATLLSRRPDQCSMEGVSNPVPAPQMLSDTRLFALDGAQLWPDPQQINRLAVEMAQSISATAGKRDPDDFGPFWWRAVARRQAAHRVETERQDARLRQMEQEQTERINREERERWAAAHGGVR